MTGTDGGAATMDIINSGQPVQFFELVLNDVVDDNSEIAIIDASGHVILTGQWYEDRILEWCPRKGLVTGDSHRVEFRLCGESEEAAPNGA